MNTSEQPTQLFKITKSYDGFPSKNKVVESELSWERAIEVLDGWKSLSRRNGASIISESETHYTCELYDDVTDVTFEIVED